MRAQFFEKVFMKKILATMLIGAVCAIPSFTFAQEQLSGGSSRLRARLNPVIAVDASGHAELERGAGTNDRFTAEVEIAKDDFDVLDISPGNGFGDEVVLLRVLRDGAEIFRTFLRFSENRPSDITFETDIQGVAAPELRAGDVGRVSVNGHFTLRGRFRVD